VLVLDFAEATTHDPHMGQAMTAALGDYADRLRVADVELLAVIHIGYGGDVIARRISSGFSVAESPFPIRSIVADALNLGSAGLLIAHNHPSGLPKPSDEDVEQTRRLERILAPLDIVIADHLIVTRNGSYSLRRNGLI
jgi:DNA repair protein RadC